MFSSLATFLFGAQPTSESTNSQANPVQNNANPNDTANDQPVGDVIEVTSTTPSVAGNNRGTVRLSNGKRGGAKNRRGRQRHQQNQQQQQQQQGGQRKQPATLTKLLTPNGECVIEDDFNEDEWYIVEKEDEEDDSLPRSDSEEELSLSKAAPSGSAAAANAAATTRRRQHINSHSLYSGPRPQQQRNHLQRTRAARTLSISTLSPPRSVPDSDNAVSQSLYAPVVVAAAAAISPSGSESSGGSGGSGKGLGSGVLMEESWYVTPPPCFTSIGPINMEASPFENLLIEHPSMSVYHSIRSSQAGTESFVNLDLGSAELPQLEPEPEPAPAPVAAVVQQQQQQAPRNHNAYFDRHAAEKLKQQTLARQSQKSLGKQQHQQLCRSAMKRANKVREFQAKGQRPRRSDMQHCKLLSGANNNRKCC
ncbi:uncharacterized protein LOC115762621 isoform X1 [Drosophila novamexicana]|uniref:uncharacterized protein LOC115762621 isoform X1 n=1 Tax=Drosophila novamexicana TaxID=47314 RepID=UPI0011E5A879|nr:uncharacterized protein LOC115762621 isoform X1 [Drosophila novamexicana]XP_030560779.1 uncharacterized protein LOC115762621 isoform X1 [Drosophila novamexicana]XP_030560780.1 uncharacterized protein LOC115762621 isoform X1 [Drosophila novamexicana]